MLRCCFHSEGRGADDMAAPEAPDPGRPLPNPGTTFFHVFFKVSSLLYFFTCTWWSTHYAIQFVGTIVLCAFDFWWTKNVSGRFMVGMRYWQMIDENNKEEWRFEHRDAEGMARVHPAESKIFWYALYGTPPAWFLLLFMELARFNLDYAMMCGISLSMCSFNAYGYTKCSKDAQAAISTFATRTLLSSVVHALV